MLQRAASNAYSWWWASHIRTTQSKWLDANLQDMENRVKVMLKLLEEEADTFGKRAEMYYRRRPQVITHVEEVYRAYRALVERYDHLSKELHKANHTIATACPEEVQYAMLEEEDANFPRAILPINSRKIQKSTVEEILKRKREGPLELKKGGREKSAPHMSKDKAEEEIGRLQKAILILQTEKEFVKSSYESGIAKYWEIEKQIADMQEEICHMQDDFDTDAAIDDDEARALMTITALKSCQGMVADLVEKFEELIKTANIESEKIKSLREKLYAMKRSIGSSTGEVSTTNMTENGRVYSITHEILELQNIYEEIENFFKKNSESSVEEMSQKVDELVDKVINLELEFPKQSAQIKKLKEENKSVENKLYDLQDEIALRDDPSDLSEELRLVESELDGMEVLARSIVEEELVVSNFFSEVFSCITDISKAFGGTTPEHLTGLSTATGEGATPSEDTCIDNSTKENTSMKEQEMREMETPSRGDHDSTGGTHGIHYSKDGEEENFYDLMEEEFKDEKSLQAGNHVDPIVGSDNENSLNKTCEGKAEGSSEQIDQSSSACTNQNCDTSKDPSVEVDESSFGGGNKSQNWRIDSDESILGYFLIQDEGLGVGDGKTPKTQGNDADKILDCHTGEAKLVEVLPKLDSQLPENVEGFKECRQIDSSEDTSSGHNVQDLKSRVLVDAYSSEGREGTSPYVPARDSEKTGEMYQLASEVPINSEKSSLIAQEDEPSWHEFPLDGHEGKNAILLADYTSVLLNYKETKRRLAELEKKNQEHLEETKAVIRELRTANSIKYVEIQSLRNLLESSETSTGKMGTDRSRTTLDREISVVEETILSDAVAEKIASPFEVKFRTEMDALVEENLRFLARYSMACHRMQEFDRRYQDLQNEMENSEGKIGGESEPAQKFRELRTELEVWFEQKELLNQELQLKTASLGRLQEEIAEALRASTEVPDGARFTPYEAAKFQGEVLNMQQSNNKIESELQTALESMKELEGKVIVDIRKLRESSELSSRRSSQSERESNYHSQYTPFPSLPRVPLRKFLFGPKKPKKRSSIFGCMNPSYQRQFSDL